MTLSERDILGLFLATSVAVLAGILLFDPVSIVSIAAFPVICAALVLAWGILRGNRTAAYVHLFVVIFLMQAVFRVRDYQDKDVDFQVILKLGVWLTVVLLAIFHGRRWLHMVLVPGNYPWMFFLLWLLATTLVSKSPAYTLVSVFTVVASVLFAAYIFSSFDEVQIFAVIVVSIASFCVISIVVYFVAPQFGHFVYWQNGERFISSRLAGIAGSSNNLALIASFCVVVVGIYAREFHRINVFFVPISGLIAFVTLLMTESRGPLGAAVAILFIVYMLHWHRIYAAVMLGSLGLLAVAALIPKGETFMMKLVSRSGSVGEITSFTGRTEIWHAVLQLASASPWMGYGYASSVFVLPEHASQIGFTTSHAHNLVLQLLLTTGMIGVLLFVLSVLSVLVRATAQRDRVVFAMMLFVLFNGVTESSGFTTLANICTFAYAIAVTMPPLQRQQECYENDLAYQRGLS